MLPTKRQCIGDGIQTNQISRMRPPIQPTDKGVHSYAPNELSMDLTSRTSQTHCTSHLENNTFKQQQRPFLSKNCARLREDDEPLPAASARLPAKEEAEMCVKSSSSGMNSMSHHGVMYCFGMVYFLASNSNVGEVNRLLDCWKLCLIFAVKKRFEPTVLHRQQSYAAVPIQKRWRFSPCPNNEGRSWSSGYKNSKRFNSNYGT